MNLVFIFRIIAVLVWVGVGVVFGMILEQNLSDDDNSNDFVRTITGLECHQLEQYILEMEYRWDDVIQYHSFRCLDFSLVLEDKHETVKDNDVGEMET